MRCFMLEPVRYAHPLCTSGVVDVLPGFRMVGNPDHAQPAPWGLNFGGFKAMARAIAMEWADQPPDRRGINLVCALRRCCDLRWREQGPSWGDVLRGLMDGCFRVARDVEILSPLADELWRRYSMRPGWVWFDFEDGPSIGDADYAEVIRTWRLGTGKAESELEGCLRRAAYASACVLVDAVGWGGVAGADVVVAECHAGQVDTRANHRWEPAQVRGDGGVRGYTTVNAKDSVADFRDGLAAAKLNGCAGVMIFTAAGVTDEHLEAHRAAIVEMTGGVD